MAHAPDFDIDQPEDRADLAAQARDAAANLRPAARMIFDAVDPEVSRAVRERGSRPLLIAASVFSGEWQEIAGKAIRASVRAAWPDPFLPFTVMSTSAKHGDRRLIPFEIENVASQLRENHPCICMFDADDEPPEILHVIADAFIDVSEPTRDDIAGRLGLLHGAAALPFDMAPASILPLEFDFAVSRGRTPAERLDLLVRVRGGRIAEALDAAAVPTSGRKGPRLDELRGFGAAGDWGLQLVADLTAYRAGEIGWEDVDAGALLVGPPGTGKTLFAQALANSAGVTFIATSYAQWQSSRGGHLGDVTKAIRAVFERAAKDLPAIVFIDEIDTVQGRGSQQDHDAWFTAIVTCLLECLDGIGRREGVVVIAACNDDRNLDAALIRSGRLDRRFWMDLPDEASLAAIFRHHLGDGIDQAVIDRVAMQMAGTISGADVVRIARDARRRARLARRPLDGDDLIAVAIPPDTRSPTMIRRIAIHEAGHAVVRMAMGKVPAALSLIAGDGGAGHVRYAIGDDGFEGLAVDLHRHVVALLAGRAAEEVVLGAASAGAGGSDGSDLAQATRLLARMEGSLGLGSSLVHGAEIDGRIVHGRLARLYAETLVLVSRHRPAIEALAALAIERRVLGRSALEKFSKEFNLQP